MGFDAIEVGVSRFLSTTSADTTIWSAAANPRANIFNVAEYCVKGPPNPADFPWHENAAIIGPDGCPVESVK